MERDFADKLLQAVRPATTNEVFDPQAILHNVYTAIVEENYEAFGEAVTDDVELHIRGFGPMDGTWRGRNEVLEATRTNFARVDAQQPEIEGMIVQRDSVAVLLRESGVLKSTGQAYSIRAVQWFTFVDGKIKKIDEIVASLWKQEV